MDKKTAILVLSWCLKLTMCGMPTSYIRYWLVKKYEEIEHCDDTKIEAKFK
jgi:hypothetical protein